MSDTWEAEVTIDGVTRIEQDDVNAMHAVLPEGAAVWHVVSHSRIMLRYRFEADTYSDAYTKADQIQQSAMYHSGVLIPEVGEFRIRRLRKRHGAG